MKRSLWTVLFSLVLWSVSAATPLLQFTEKSYDLGTISERGGAVSHAYAFRNCSDQPIVILSAETSCSCTKGSFSRKPIPPGATGTVIISYNPRNQHGVFNKAIRIYTNALGGSYVVMLKGEVVR